MRIIARSRIGFWTAFETAEGAFLNVRDENLLTVTIMLSRTDREILAGNAEVCHPHASHLARFGRRLPEPLPTPPRGVSEPEPHEWQPKTEIRTVERLMAA